MSTFEVVREEYFYGKAAILPSKTCILLTRAKIMSNKDKMSKSESILTFTLSKTVFSLSSAKPCLDTQSFLDFMKRNFQTES